MSNCSKGAHNSRNNRCGSVGDKFIMHATNLLDKWIERTCKTVVKNPYISVHS